MNDFYYRKLKVYQEAKELVVLVNLLIKRFPKEEKYALSDQLRRAVISVPSNIAEGMGRMAIGDRLRFLEFSFGSLMETMCQVEIAHSLDYISDEDLLRVETCVKDISRMMSGLRTSLNNKQPGNRDEVE